MKRIKYLFPLALVTFVPACGECEGGWRSYTGYMPDLMIEMWTADGSLDFSDGLDIHECDKLCQPGGIEDFRGCSEYKRVGYYAGADSSGAEQFVPEWAGGAGGQDRGLVIGYEYYSIKCTYFVRNTCGQLFPPP